ncbi:MAG: hypothetical protein R3F46_05250 [bacterium]
MDKPEQPASLSWSFNPWQQGLGGWRRPQLALPLSLLLAVLLSWSVTVPNVPLEYEQQLVSAGEELGAAPFAMIGERQYTREQIAAELEQIRTAREQFPRQWLQWGLISLLLLLGMNASLYLPAAYELNEQGVKVSFMGLPSLRRWEHYRNYYAHERLVHLSTMPRPSALDPFRGHSLMFGPDNREAVLGFIAVHVRKREQ